MHGHMIYLSANAVRECNIFISVAINWLKIKNIAIALRESKKKKTTLKESFHIERISWNAVKNWRKKNS